MSVLDNLFLLLQTYIDCLHIKKSDKSRVVADDQMEVENRLGGNVDDLSFDEAKVWTFLAFFGFNIYLSFLSCALTFLIEMQVEELKELSKKPDIYDRLTRSLAPNIWELDDVKRGLLCQVFSTFLLLPFPALF